MEFFLYCLKKFHNTIHFILILLNNGPIPYTHHIQAKEIPEVIQKRLGLDSKDKYIHYENKVMKILISPNHYWKMANTFIKTIQTLKDAQEVEFMKKDILQAIAHYI